MSQITIIEQIVASKKDQLEIQKSSMPLSSFANQLKASDRDFEAALRTPSPGFILECKKASPSKGTIRPDFDLVSISRTYGKYASAISVLTESEYFQGSMANLGIVHQNVSQPILCKDFIVDPYQVSQSRHFGADAILLILSILDDGQWEQLFRLAKSMGMDVVTEVSNLPEQKRAIGLGAPIVGINNRNLHDMSIDLDTTRNLSQGLAEDTLVISESGFYEHAQVRSMCEFANGFLIGSALMGEADLSSAVKRMIFGECKVCGLTRQVDAMAADNAGALYGGVIFADSSSRKVDVDDVENIFARTDLIRVGVFQDHSVGQIVEIAQRCRLQAIQLHGDEIPSLIGQLIDQLGPDYQYWKALSVNQVSTHADTWLSAGANRLVVDNHCGTLKGGTGVAFDWSSLPCSHRECVILAGGIGPDNVAQAIKQGCAGVDMNSKLEDSPGIKSDEKIKQAFGIIREY